ncbi:hypothetical protein EB796_015787 [Bugula neritina]|uniref:Uncharacterized protein n=1 Tax=Bugula neritina TaxID=10212 RepID=A0A7J7JJX2_BUGNE|nr:hypothetical protein EB796_015787 [Bugula neritina]
MEGKNDLPTSEQLRRDRRDVLLLQQLASNHFQVQFNKSSSKEGLANPESSSKEGLTNPESSSKEGLANPESSSKEGLANPESSSKEGLANPESSSKEGLANPESSSKEGLANPERFSKEGLTNPESSSKEGLANPESSSKEGLANPESSSKDKLTNPQSSSENQSAEKCLPIAGEEASIGESVFHTSDSIGSATYLSVAPEIEVFGGTLSSSVESTKTLYSLLIKKEEAMADLLISLKNSQSFPKSGLVVFIVLTDFYLLLLQELMLIDSSKESQWLPQIKLTSKMCVRHLLTLYTTLWKVRLEGISNVHNYTCGNNQNSDFQCVATVLDIYNRRSSSIILSTILCQLADDDAIHKTFQLYVSILHEKYIADVFTYFDKTLQFPVGSCQTWMKICLPSSSRMASCRVLNSKYSQLSDLVPVFTVIELEPVESSESVVLPYLENLEEDEYAYARCEVKVDKEGSNSVTLFELACVPESMKTELLKRNKQIEEKELIDKIVIRILNARCAKQ